VAFLFSPPADTETMAETEKTSPPLKRSQFVCPKCKGEDGQGALFFFALIENVRETDKGAFVADCPQCGAEGTELWYMANMRLAQGKQTGPTTEAGKNKVRMNGYTTGSKYLSGAIPKYIPPAKPGKFAECETCQDIADCKEEVAAAQGTSRYVACHRQGEIMAKYRNAHLSGDPESLRLMAADIQSKMHRVMMQCFKAIFDNDVFLTTVVLNNGQPVYIDVGGKRVPLIEKKINPAINESVKILEKMGFSLTDWTLTPKSKEAKAALEGYLAGKAAAEGKPIDEFMAEHNKAMKDFQSALTKGNTAAQQDETLRESEADERTGDA
jgi:hypothetical protein